MVEALISVVVGALLPGVLWENRFNSLTAAVMGLIVSWKVNMWEMGIGAPGKAKAVHRGKRIHRWMHNENISVNELSASLIRVLTVGTEYIMLAIDWTDLGRWKVLQVAIVTRGRALPVFWRVIDETKRRMRDVELELCETLVGVLIPPNKKVLVIGDRGFDSSDIIAFLRARRIKFVMRFSNGTCLRQRLENAAFELVETMLLPVGQTVDYGMVHYTKTAAVPARVVRTWETGQEEPWNLVTNLGRRFSPELIVKLYARRFTIEELFRDYKEGDWELGRTTIKTSDTMERSLAIAAVAHLTLMTIGTWAREAGRERDFRSTPGLSLFQLGRRVLWEGLRGTGDLPALNFQPPFQLLPVDLEDVMGIPWRRRKTTTPSQVVSEANSGLGQCLRALMIDRNLRQLDVLPIIGCKQSSISMVIRGKQPLPLAWLPKLLQYTGLTEGEFRALGDKLPELLQAVELEKQERAAAKLAIQSDSLTQIEPIPAQCLQTYMLERGFRQSEVATIVGSSQGYVSTTLSRGTYMPATWLPKILEHSGLTEAQFRALGSRLAEVLRENQAEADPVISDPAPEPIPGACLRVYLEELRLRQTTLAEILGCAQSTISHVASGKAPVPARWIPKLLEHAGLTETELRAFTARLPATHQPSSLHDDDAEGAHQRRQALQALWRRHKKTEIAAVVGVRQPVVARAISGHRPCPREWITRLCAAYRLSQADLLELADGPHPGAA